MNIYQRLSAITSELTAVAKNLSVGVGSSSYKGVGEADVLSAVKPLEQKHGVYSYPVDREIVYSETFMGEKPGYKKDDPPKTTYKFMVRIKTTYRFVNVDDPKETVDMVSYGDGEDPMDKAPGKAMTYSDKYALLKAYKIITGDDPDQNHSNDTTPSGMKPLSKEPTEEQRIKQNMPDKMLLEANSDQALTRKVMNLTLAEFGFANWKAYNPKEVSEKAFMAMFSNILKEQK